MATFLNEIEQQIREELIGIAQKGDPHKTTYQELSNKLKLGLDMSDIGDRNRLGHHLGNISRFEHEHSRGLLSVLVFNDQKNRPGDGFFELAQDPKIDKLKQGAKDDDKVVFFSNELTAVYKFWKK